MKEVGVVLFFVVLIVGAIMGGCSTYVIQPGDRGIAVTFGKMYPETLPEGLGFCAPWTDIHRVTIKNVMSSSETDCFTSDTQVVKVKYSILLSIPEKQVTKLYSEYSCIDSLFKSLVVPRTEEVLKQLTAQHRADDIVKQRDTMRAAAIGKIKEAVGNLLNITDINITNIDLTDALEKAIEEKTISEQHALAAKYGVDKARQEAEATLIKAQAEAKAIFVTGEALKQSQSIVFLEAIKKWDGHAPQTMLVGSGITPVLPIDNTQFKPIKAEK